MRKKVIVVGSLNYDIFTKIPHRPELGENLPVDEVSFSAGGKGANQAVQAAKLGMETYMAGCVGSDAMGDMLLASAEKFGLHTEYIRRTEEPTGMGLVSVLPDGSVYANIIRGANFAITREDVDRLGSLWDEAGYVMIQMEIPMDINRYVIDKAKAHGCKVVLNAAPAEKFENEYMKKCDILVVNEVEAGFYANEVIDSLEKACRLADKKAADMENSWIITMGKQGAVVSNGQKHEVIPSEKVNAIETTGAGDSFIGGMIYALNHKMDLFDACRFATKCSAVTVSRVGAQDSMPTLKDLNTKQ